MLNVVNLDVFFGKNQILHQVSLEIEQGEVVAVIGNNGSGKSTLLNSIAGLNKKIFGRIEYKKLPILGKQPEVITKAGISLVYQGGRVFKYLTVLDNLRLGAFLRNSPSDIDRDMSLVFEMFPVLKKRLKWQGGKLSGGERQMLAISRSLMSNPDLLMLDEPTFGLSPIMVEELTGIIRQLNDQGKTILLVEQNAHMALGLASRGYVFEVGRIILSGSANELISNNDVKEAYLGRKKSESIQRAGH